MASSQVSQISQLVHPQTHCDSVKCQQIENFIKKTTEMGASAL